MMTEYDRIGSGYATTRRADPRIAARVERALAGAVTVVNVGAGAGSYEPAGLQVTAVEPSQTMIDQRREGTAQVVRAEAEQLPFRDGTFDAAIAILTVHHWHDLGRGISEIRRVAGRQIVLTWDPSYRDRFWLTREYLPAVGAFDCKRFPSLDELGELMGGASVEAVPIPHDCQDGFLGAFWRRPRAYLDPAVRSGMSTFAALGDRDLSAGLKRLAVDLERGVWQSRHGALASLDELDLGYRLLSTI